MASSLFPLMGRGMIKISGGRKAGTSHCLCPMHRLVGLQMKTASLSPTPAQVLICRNYRGDVDMSEVEHFMPILMEKEEEGVLSPILAHGGVRFMWIKHNNLYRIPLQGSPQEVSCCHMQVQLRAASTCPGPAGPAGAVRHGPTTTA